MEDQYLSRDPDMMTGALCFKGTRVPVQSLFGQPPRMLPTKGTYPLRIPLGWRSEDYDVFEVFIRRRQWGKASPDEPPGRASLVWSWREESNLQPAVYKTAALPIELRQHGRQ